MEDGERSYSTEERTVPLVLEASPCRDPAALTAFLSSESAQVRRALDEYGAILLRGFDVRSDHDFARVVSSIPGFRPMTGYFLAEPGRTLARGSDCVFHTSTLAKTGGGFNRVAGFHSENFYSTDTPAFQSFWCKRSPWLGGETVLVHMPRVYAELGEETKARLQGLPVCVPRLFRTLHVARAYGLSEAFIEQFFADLGYAIVSFEERRFIVMEKPIVYRHPSTGALTISANLSNELQGLNAALHRLLAPRYSGWKWSLHRWVWRDERLTRLFVGMDHFPTVLRHHPRMAVGSLIHDLRNGGRKRRETRIDLDEFKRTHQVSLGQKLNASDVQALAESIARHCSFFSWKRGDILIWDNLQMLHTGMPGLGPRELHVMLCNPLALRRPVEPGPAEVAVDDRGCETVDAQLREARRSERCLESIAQPAS